MTREEFYKLTDILNSEVLGNFMHGGEADELIAMFEEAAGHSNILEQEEPVSDELEEAAIEWFNSVKYKSDLSGTPINAFKAGAKWQKSRLWKPADGDSLPEIGREVIALTQPNPNDEHIKVVFAHRPNPNGWDGISFITKEIEHYTPKTYDKGGWNIPNVKYWLDVELPKEIEL